MSSNDKKPNNTIFYIVGIVAFLLAVSGIGSVIGIPLLGYICIHAFMEADNRDKRYEEEKKRRGY